MRRINGTKESERNNRYIIHVQRLAMATALVWISTCKWCWLVGEGKKQHSSKIPANNRKFSKIYDNVKGRHWTNFQFDAVTVDGCTFDLLLRNASIRFLFCSLVSHNTYYIYSRCARSLIYDSLCCYAIQTMWVQANRCSYFFVVYTQSMVVASQNTSHRYCLKKE